MPDMRFRVGELTNPLQSDPWFGDEAAAIDAARLLSADAFNTPYAVWEMLGCTVVRILFDGKEFTQCRT